MDDLPGQIVDLERLEQGFVRLAPLLENTLDRFGISLEFIVSEDDGLDLRSFDSGVAVAVAVAPLEQCRTQGGENRPIGFKGVDVAVGDAAVQVRIEVVQVLQLAGIDCSAGY